MKIHLKFETLDNLKKIYSSCIPTNINKNKNSAILKLRDLERPETR